jgi:hypothetical protein
MTTALSYCGSRDRLGTRESNVRQELTIREAKDVKAE